MSVFPIFISLHIEKYETISAQTKENLSFFVFLSQYARLIQIGNEHLRRE